MPAPQPITVALDAMGGDHGASVVVPAALRALTRHEQLHLILVGDRAVVEGALPAHDIRRQRIRVHHASQTVAMDEAPAQALRSKKDSSMRVALRLVKEGQAQACVSAGNTGALMATARYVLKTLPGIERPAIITAIPAQQGHTHMLDLGANVDCTAAHLAQFASMGSTLASAVDGLEHPRVGLLNVGAEQIKGNEQVKEAYELLRDADALNFAGNVEGSDLLFYAADIIVCDGFVGNALLKFGESMTTVLTEMCQQEMDRQDLSPDEKDLVAGVFDEVRKGFDPEAQGGAPLLGVNGNVLVGHGSSTPDTIAQMIHSAATLATEDVVHTLEDAFGSV